MSEPSQSEPSWSRRGFITALAGVTVVGGSIALPGRAQARTQAGVVTVPHLAFGAIVSAIAGPDLAIAIDPSLPLANMRAGDLLVSLADRVLLKGEGTARRRYLDDARNAPKLGAAVRDHLRTQWPELGDAFVLRHKTWSRALVRNILRWTQALEASGLRGKRVRAPGDFVYLIEWAGAELAGDGIEPPKGLLRAAREPAAATAEGYREYVQGLVDAVSR